MIGKINETKSHFFLLKLAILTKNKIKKHKLLKSEMKHRPHRNFKDYDKILLITICQLIKHSR